MNTVKWQTLIYKKAKKIFLYGILNYFLVFLLSIDVLFAQNEEKVIRQGKKLIEHGFHLKALDKFNSIIENDSSFSEVNLLASICYLELHEPNSALRLIKTISNEENCINYYKALCYYNLENFDEAIRLLQGVEEISCYHRLKKDELVSLIEDASRTYKYSKGFLVRNFGANINTKDREYCAVMLNKFDSVLFTSRRTESHRIVAEDGMGYESIYTTSVDKDQNWSNPSKLNLDIQSKRNHNATAQVITEGKEVIIFHNGDLHFAKKVNDKWVQQQRLRAINTRHNETHCYLTSDQCTIYFSSDYLSDDNTLDLFVTTKNSDGVWSEPEAIVELNTPYDEDAPFISEDGTFYFSSRGHNSLGGFDVFSTRYNKETNSWAPIVNLGHPVNTVADDIYFNTYGKVGYVSSSRLGGEGMLDLYQVLLFNKIKLQGKISTANNNIPIPGATVDITYGHWFLRGYSDYEGNYEMYVPINKSMQVSIHKDTVNLHKGNYIVKVSFNNENENEYNFTADLNLYQNEEPVMSTDFLNPSDTVTINLQVKNDLQRNELIKGIPETHEKEWLDSLNAYYNEKHIYESLPAEHHQKQEDLSLDTILVKVHFEFDSFELKDSVKLMLKNRIEILSQTQYDQLEICGYTDAVGSDMYNQILSIRRAEAVSNFLIDHGISVEKMLVKGLGKKNLLENQEEESAINRRVELIFKRSVHAHIGQFSNGFNAN